ncbi:MAG: tetratricopeptide repeat protein [Chryseolinea sp.]
MMETKDLEKLISLGHYAQARKRAEELLTKSDSLRAKQLYAFSLSKSGQPEAAREFLERVARDHPDDPETNGILGGIYKELFRNQQNSAFAVLSRDTYDRSFTRTKNFYTGINAATMSTLAGQSRRGKELAQEVLDLLKNPEQDFWEAVTRAEALLLLKERSKSEEAYRKARHLAGSDWGKINSVYNQLWLLKHYLPVPREALSAFSPPVVVAFVGHMIDHPDRANPRFPAGIEGQIKQAITSSLNTVNARIGYCSLANGGDILFAEALEELNGEVNLFLPFSQSDFLAASVSFAGDQWTERFLRLVNKYPVTYLTEEPHAGHADLFGLQTSILFGLSHLRSLATHAEPYLITVMSERDQQRKSGGTRDTVGLWPNQQRHININPDVYVPITAIVEEAGSASAQYNRTDRPVLYFVCFDLSADDPTGEAVLTHLTNASLPPAVTWRKGHEMVAGFKQLLGAMEFTTHILTSASPLHPSPRVTLHVGPFPLQRVSGIEYYPRVEEGGPEEPIAALEQLTDIHHFTHQGSVYASGAFGALLALDTARYKLSFIDTLREVDKRPIRPIDVFSVSLLHISKLVNH